MKVERERLLAELEAVHAFAQKGGSGQAGCFLFSDGFVSMFGDEVAASSPCSVEIDGAVAAEPLVALLKKMKDVELELDAADGALCFKGKGKRAKVNMEVGVDLPMNVSAGATKWKKVPSGLLRAMVVAASCCKRDDGANFSLSCVHVDEDRVEACDDLQLLVWPMRTGMGGSMLVRHESVGRIADASPREMARDGHWLHFKCGGGLVVSCRAHATEYPDVGRYLEVDGVEMSLPKDLGDMLDKARIFSSLEGGDELVKVSFKKGRLHIKGENTSGSYEEQKPVDYGGEPLSFFINPTLLLEIGRKSNTCVFGDNKLKVCTGDFSYMACTFCTED